ncbi:copper resistance D family protein [Pseudonocardia acaciae]|uniref:copper resistance D family protein n=1 Tax=Pseudonocardia acaciae TaxID=551276 RepID=UPI000688F57E|nr:CopD family protein [Pseudonocardia acaciae]
MGTAAGRGTAPSVGAPSVGTPLLVAGLGAVALASVVIGMRIAAGVVPRLETATAAARLAVDALGAAEIGLALLPFLVGGLSGDRDRAESVARARRAAFRRAARLGALVGAAWAIAAVLALWLQAAGASGSSPLAVRAGALVDYAGRIAAGRGLLLTLGCALVATVAALAWASVQSARPRRSGHRFPELAVGAALLGVLPGPVTGHAAGHGNHEPAVLVIALHVIAAGAWVGGLLAVLVVLARHRRLLADALPRFATAAGCCAAVVAASGVLSAVFRLPAPAALVGTGYGALVLAKAAGLGGLLALGWRARRRLSSWVAGPSTARAPLARWLGLELAVMAVVFGLGPALASSAPA